MHNFIEYVYVENLCKIRSFNLLNLFKKYLVATHYSHQNLQLTLLQHQV